MESNKDLAYSDGWCCRWDSVLAGLALYSDHTPYIRGVIYFRAGETYGSCHPSKIFEVTCWNDPPRHGGAFPIFYYGLPALPYTKYYLLFVPNTQWLARTTYLDGSILRLLGVFARIEVLLRVWCPFSFKTSLEPPSHPIFQKIYFFKKKQKNKMTIIRGPSLIFTLNYTPILKPLFWLVFVWYCHLSPHWILARNGKHWTNQYLEAYKRRSPVEGRTPAISWRKTCGWVKKRSQNTVRMSFQSRTRNQRLFVNLGIN